MVSANRILPRLRFCCCWLLRATAIHFVAFSKALHKDCIPLSGVTTNACSVISAVSQRPPEMPQISCPSLSSPLVDASPGLDSRVLKSWFRKPLPVYGCLKITFEQWLLLVLTRCYSCFLMTSTWFIRLKDLRVSLERQDSALKGNASKLLIPLTLPFGHLSVIYVSLTWYW